VSSSFLRVSSRYFDETCCKWMRGTASATACFFETQGVAATLTWILYGFTSSPGGVAAVSPAFDISTENHRLQAHMMVLSVNGER
jgi:hypothetical protein